MSQISVKNQTLPETPVLGKTEIWVDSITKTIWSRDDDGVITQYGSSASSNFSYDRIIANMVLTIPQYQQMLVHQEITIQGELIPKGELVVL